MPSHLALLRGINVGGHHKVPMAALRDLVTGLGHRDVATYIQSGNLVFTPATEQSTAEVGLALRTAIGETFGFAPLVVVATAPEWERVVAANPYSVEDLRRLHVFIQQDAFDAEQALTLQQLRDECRSAGSRDDLTVVDRACYLSTPDGFGRSVLAEKMSRLRPAGPDRLTARNWATVLRLRQMLVGD